ncbi:MAG: efflux RND transporter permease subunit [Deltaproteobacteria bacterium]|nr:efflux RND transporter permease subunit [Deltaproteobacteria bacterium]
MRLETLSIKRPIFITCVVLAMLACGYLSLLRLPVDLFPSVTFPVVMVNTAYPGAGPKEIETLVSKPLEDEISTLTGIKALSSINREGWSTVVAQFTLETDVKYAEQQIRDRVSSTKSKLPKDIKEPVVRRIDPADQPIVILALKADLPEAAMADLASERLRPKIESVNQVGLVEVVGARKREIHVELDRAKLKSHDISATMVANRLNMAGQDVPVGKVNQSSNELVFRAMGEFKSLKEIGSQIVNFVGNDVPVTIDEIGRVTDSLVDEKARTWVNGAKAIQLLVYKQTGANTIGVSDDVRARVAALNEEMKNEPGHPSVTVVRDTSKYIRFNVEDVKESIFIGIALTILVVFLFLGNVRSTLITGVALPNSLLGAFILMAVAGFTINVMTLLALSLAVGLLIDDAIVVRENIFRHAEEGMSPVQAAITGTREVALAVIATTLTVIAVFGPIAFLKGVVGQFFKEFGLTICFAMLISLFDAFTMAPMLSAYLGGVHGKKGKVASGIDAFHARLERTYGRVIGFVLRRPLTVLAGSFVVFVLSIASIAGVPKTFLPPQDNGEFAVSLETPPGTNLEAMSKLSQEVDAVIRANKEVAMSLLIVGGGQGSSSTAEANSAQFYVELVPRKDRTMNTSQFKDKVREQLKKYSNANPVVKDFDAVNAGMRPFNVIIVGSDLKELEKVAAQAFEKIRKEPGLKDVETSFKPGKPELQVALDTRKAETLGISTMAVGGELRTLVEGATPAVYRENGIEYDVRVRLREDQRNLSEGFEQTYVPNVNNSIIRLATVARPVQAEGPANILRRDRGRYIQISGDLTPGGAGMSAVMKNVTDIMTTQVKLPPGMRFAFVGQAEDFKDLMTNMVTAMGLGILFIFLVLASLYESFITPLTIMLVLPLAACGAFFALFITRYSLDIFSMIGCIMLMGIATKNSILLVDYANQLVREGKSRAEAIRQAGEKRLRPILMTTVALISGMLPVAIGLNEASRQRVSMGVAVIGGLVSSTLLTLVVVPAAYSYIDRFRIWSGGIVGRIFRVQTHANEARAAVERAEKSINA